MTNPRTPVALKELILPTAESTASLDTVIGSVALVSSVPAPTTSQTVSILSFPDPEHPTVVKQFLGVTATGTDVSHGLIYLANSEGIWVLHINPATDEQLEKDYAHYVRYDR
jgi:hypothetical protein